MTKQEWKWIYSEIRSLTAQELKQYERFIHLLKTDRTAAKEFYEELFPSKTEEPSA